MSIYLQVIIPIFSVFLMALSYNLPSDSTNIIPMTLGTYKYSTALYSSDNETIGKGYEDIVRYYGETVKPVSSHIGIENGM